VATYWYQRIQNPDAVVQRATAPVSEPRLRYIANAQWSGMFRDEPEVLQAFVNADVPFAVAQRTMAEIGREKARQRKILMENAGYTQSQMDPSWVSAAQDATPPQPQISAAHTLRDQLAVDMAQRSTVATRGERGFWGSVVDVGKGIVGGAVEGLNRAFSVVSSPLAAGSALPDTNQERYLNQFGDLQEKIPVFGQLGNVGIAGAEGIIDYAKGLNSLLFGVDPKYGQTQQQDMQRAGYDPNSFKSRYSYYYQEFNGKRQPVAERDIQKLKNDFNPAKVELARELVTSGYFDDPVKNFNGLSPEAQVYARNLTTLDQNSEDGRLLRAMQDNSSLSFGGKVADRFEMELGSTQRKIVSGLSDLVAFWYVDPLVAVGGATKAVKYGMRGVDAASVDKVVKVLAASDDALKPLGYNAKRFDDLLRTVDTNYNLVKEGRLTEAARNTEKIRRLHPDMMGIFDTLSAMRSGSITRVRPRNETEALREAAQAGKVERQAQPFLFDSAPIGKEKPVWALTNSADEIASPETSAAVRAKMADDLGDFVWYEAITSGRPLYKGKMLLPGQVAVNRRVRAAISPVRDALTRQDSKFMKFLESQRKVIDDLDGDVLADATGRQDILTDSNAAQWVKDNYAGSIASPTLGIAKSFGKSWKYFENSFSNKTINFNSPESTELFRRWVVQFLPKRHAYALVNEFASANPAGRYGLWQQTVVASLNASGMRNTPAAKRMYDRLTKGIIPNEDNFGRTVGPLEQYSSPANNTIRVGDNDIASAVHAYQLNEGVQLPNLRELRRLMNRTSVLGYVSGSLNNPLFDTATRVWKVMKVANPANMVRQALELHALTLGQGTAGAIPEAARARYMLKAVKGQMKSDVNTIQRAMLKAQEIDHDTLAKLDSAIKSGDSATYHGIIVDALNSQGVKGRTAEALARMGEVVDVRKLVPSGLTRVQLAMAGPLDYLRRLRVKQVEKMKLQSHFDSPYADELDDLVVSQYLESALHDLGTAADNYVLLAENRGQAIRDQVSEGVALGFGYLTPRVPNSYKWTDNPSNLQWADSLRRIQDDELSNLVMRRIAMENVGGRRFADRLAKAGLKSQGLAKPGLVMSRRAFFMEELTKRGIKDTDLEGAKAILAERRLSRDVLSDPVAFARYMIGEDQLGQALRDNARRSNYTQNGRFATTPEDKAEAIELHATALVRDIVDRMGGKIHEDGRVFLPDELGDLYDKIAKGQKVTASDVARYENALKPEGVVAELFVPDIAGRPHIMRERLTQMLGKAYHLTVSGPLASLATHPMFLAHRRMAYDTLKPAMDQLVSRGMTTKQAAYMLESAANKRALNLTFNATDHPAEHSVFAELTDNFLMFNRAQEDFIKRFMRATATNPALLARARTLVDAAHHSGVMSVQQIQNDDGLEENQLVFVYPGSAVATKVIGDAWSAIGGEADNLNMLPQYRGFSSQLRFINPSLTNPLQFSANPIIGMPLQTIRAMFPETADWTTDVLAILQGGERYFAEQDFLDQYLPSAISRLIPVMNKNEVDGQYASALRSALQYAEAAGIMPEPGVGTPDEVAAAQDAVRSMVQNIMVQRAVFGVFAPAAPQLTEPGDMENNAHALAEGITNIKQEWFDILEGMNRLYPEDSGRALSESFVEWAKRYPKGQSIANANAFTVGSSQMKGSDASTPSTTEATSWMLNNLDWVKNNRSIAYYLLPTAAGKWFEAAPYRLQFRSELREHKSLEEFSREVAFSDEISLFFDMNKQKNQAKVMDPAMASQIDAAWKKWADQWAKFHPGAAAEMDRRNDPNVVHEELAPALGRAAKGDVPEELKPMLPAIRSMYNDYLTYREAYMQTPKQQRASLNARYRDYGDVKWAGSQLEKLWNAMSKYEDD